MRRVLLTLVALALGFARFTAAQQPSSEERPPLGSSLTVQALGELPASASTFALLDTSIPDVVADRTDAGGLSSGDPSRVGAHGSSWSQTIFHVGDADITDPSGSGAPLLYPGIAEWDRVDVATGLMPIDASAPGLAITLVPRRAFDGWNSNLDVFGSPPFLDAGGARTNPPSLERLNSWAHANLLGGGPLVPDRLAAFISGTWTRASHFERTSDIALDSNLASGFGNLTATPSPGNNVRLTGWVQRTNVPIANHDALGQPAASETDRVLHVQGAWEHQFSDSDRGFRVFGAYTVRGRDTDVAPSPFIVVERLIDGPMPNILDPGPGTDRVWEFGARAHGTVATEIAGHHSWLAGVDWSGNSMSTVPAFSGRIGELLDGVPARVWDWTAPAGGSSWHQMTLAGFASDTIALTSRLTVNGGARMEMVRGFTGADASSPAISWLDVYPRAGLHAALTDFWQIAVIAQYARYGHRLPLPDLAFGDPTAPTANVYRWNGGSLAPGSPLGPVVQRYGPGTGGDPAFSAIDPDISRPHMDEVVFGFESHPKSTTFGRMVAIARRERSLIGAVDVGAPDSSYSQIGIPDPGVDLAGSGTAETLIFYNRMPSTFGLDRYLLTNPADDEATFVGVDVMAQVKARRLFVIAGGTAGRSEGISASRGFGPLENDAAILGEVYIDPNARGHAQGRLFTERGYTIKTALAYDFGHDISGGLIGRYEDGQHFARLVIEPGLNQGPEAVRAFRNGRTRFTYSMTVDARVQKAFQVGAHRISVMIDAYNVFNQALEVEEFEVTGVGARLPTAVQPPRVVHLGVRIPF